MSTKPLLRKDLPGPLPPELWLDIMPDLPSPTIKNLSLTCQSFRHAAQPLLFRRLVFTFDPGPNTPLDGMLAEKYVEWSTQKMTYCGAEMNTAVREVYLSLPRPRQAQKHLSDSLYSQLLNTILCSLPNLTNLNALGCTNMTFSAQHISNLCLSGRVPQLFIHECRWEIPQPEDLPHRLRVSALTISTKEDVVYINGWHEFVESDSVSLSVVAATSQSLSSLKTYPHIIQNLSSLQAEESTEVLPILAEILSLRPPLRSLHMFYKDFRDSVTLSEITAHSYGSLPLLETYEGPFELLPLISTKQSLAQLKTVRLRAQFDSESAVVYVASAAQRLERLSIIVHSLTRSMIIALIDHCSMLKDLTIVAETPNLTGFDSVSVCHKLLIHVAKN